MCQVTSASCIPLRHSAHGTRIYGLDVENVMGVRSCRVVDGAGGAVEAN